MTQPLRPDDPRLTWQGAVSLERADGWVAPWRIPFGARALFPPQRLRERLAMPAGVRIVFRSNTTHLAGRLASPNPESSPIDLCCDGVLLATVPLAGRETFCFSGLPQGDKLIELWLPQFGSFRLLSLELSESADVARHSADRPRWITYGSSITQCRAASSPTQTWPAIVSRARGLDLLCLGVGGECHLDAMIARVIRDQPADLISLALGINVMGGASLSPRTFRPAVISFVQIIREKHPECPVIVRSPIFSPDRESKPNAVGFTLQMMRQEVHAAVEALTAHGDCNTHYVDGLEVLGPEFAHLLPDGLHPNADGYRVMGQRFSKIVAGYPL